MLLGNKICVLYYTVSDRVQAWRSLMMILSDHCISLKSALVCVTPLMSPQLVWNLEWGGTKEEIPVQNWKKGLGNDRRCLDSNRTSPEWESRVWPINNDLLSFMHFFCYYQWDRYCDQICQDGCWSERSFCPNKKKKVIYFMLKNGEMTTLVKGNTPRLWKRGRTRILYSYTTCQSITVYKSYLPASSVWQTHTHGRASTYG